VLQILGATQLTGTIQVQYAGCRTTLAKGTVVLPSASTGNSSGIQSRLRVLDIEGVVTKSICTQNKLDRLVPTALSSGVRSRAPRCAIGTPERNRNRFACDADGCRRYTECIAGTRPLQVTDTSRYLIRALMARSFRHIQQFPCPTDNGIIAWDAAVHRGS
jgi:hypothetical protein